jgi:hypothetical protein
VTGAHIEREKGQETCACELKAPPTRANGGTAVQSKQKKKIKNQTSRRRPEFIAVRSTGDILVAVGGRWLKPCPCQGPSSRIAFLPCLQQTHDHRLAASRPFYIS